MRFLFFLLMSWGCVAQNFKQEQFSVSSKELGYSIEITVLSPRKPKNIIYFNDGQDFEALGFRQILDSLSKTPNYEAPIVVGIHAGEFRLSNYGTANITDYKDRGSKSAEYQHFIVGELIPFIEKKYKIKPKQRTIAGLSLGGLSAMDIGWNHPEIFSEIGVFSGSFWWRSHAYNPEDAKDSTRIMQKIIQKDASKKTLKFWYEVGTSDETDDRNKNGIIDSVEDTRDLINELQQKGYLLGKDISYLEIKGGQHNHSTWRRVLPMFLIWVNQP